MRAGPVLVAVLSLIVVASGIMWLGTPSPEVAVQTKSDPAVTDHVAGSKPELKPHPVPSETGPHPHASLPETGYNFGVMRTGEKGEHTFHITNTGEAPLELVTGESTCQCTLGELGNGQLAPGESTTIDLKWEIKIKGPNFEHAARIHTNDPANLTIMLTVKGMVGLDLDAIQGTTWDIGLVKYNTAPTFSGIVYSNFRDDLELTRLVSSNPNITWHARALEAEERDELIYLESEPGLDGMMAPARPALLSGYAVTAELAEGFPIGGFTEQLTIHTNFESHPQMTVVVKGTVSGPFEFLALPGATFISEQMKIDAGQFSAIDGKTIRLMMVPYALDGGLQISDIKVDPEWVKASVIEKKNGDRISHFLEVEVPGGLPEVVRSSENPVVISMKTNHPRAQDLSFKVVFISK